MNISSGSGDQLNMGAVWPDGYINFHYLAIYRIKKLPKNIKICQSRFKIWSNINKFSTICQRFIKFCQSDEILPNLVTLHGRDELHLHQQQQQQQQQRLHRWCPGWREQTIWVMTFWIELKYIKALRELILMFQPVAAGHKKWQAMPCQLNRHQCLQRASEHKVVLKLNVSNRIFFDIA